MKLRELSTYLKPQPLYLCFSPNGKLMAAQYGQDNNFMIGLWDIDNNKQVLEIPVGEFHHDLCFSPDGSILAASEPFEITSLWDINKGSKIKSFNLGAGLGLKGLVFYSNGNKLIVGHGGRLHFINLKSPDTIREKNIRGVEEIECLSISNDEKFLAVGSRWDKNVYVIETKKWKTIHKFTEHNASITNIHFHPHLSILASVSGDYYEYKPQKTKVAKGKIILWDIQTGEKLKEFPCGGMWNTHGNFNSTGELIVTNNEREVIIWNVSSGRKIHRFSVEMESNVLFSTANDFLAIWNLLRISLYGVEGAPSNKKCKKCGQIIKSGDVTCSHCGYTEWRSILFNGIFSLLCLGAAIFLSPIITSSFWRFAIRLGVGGLGVIMILVTISCLIRAFKTAKK